MLNLCGWTWLAGPVLAGLGVILLLAARRRPGKELLRQDGSASRRWVGLVGGGLLLAGIAALFITAWQGDCVANAGNCPPEIGGSGYPCATEGSACKGRIWGSGKCRTESSLFGCSCECR